jgi:hypothetical protein
VAAARQIATALADHDERVTAVLPHYAMSGGTLIALAADEIVLDSHASLGPVDPQLGQYPAASLVEVARRPGDHDDQTLIMADLGGTARPRRRSPQERDLMTLYPQPRGRTPAVEYVPGPRPDVPRASRAAARLSPAMSGLRTGTAEAP